MRDIKDIARYVGLSLIAKGLTVEETELLDSIVMLYGSKSQNGLIFLTHAEQPWVEAREGLAPYQRSEKEISLDTMHAYYKARHDRNRQKQ